MTNTETTTCAQWIRPEGESTTRPCQHVGTHRIPNTDKMVCGQHARKTDIKVSR